VRLAHAVPACFVAVHPVEAGGGERWLMWMLGRSAVGNPLTVQWYAQACSLTAAEAAVLRRLCEGRHPAEIAALHGVAISTVRSQIGAVRAKTGCGSIRALLESLARLPPMDSGLALCRAPATG